MPLHRNVWQGLYGEAFIYALASAAGLTVGRMNLDTDGVDWLIAHPGPRGTKRSPKLEVQVKTWSSPRGDDLNWHYRLRARHFNQLAGQGFQVPRYLALVIVPAAPGTWTQASHDVFQLQRAAYWTSLADRPPVLDLAPEDTVEVNVPRSNLLTVQTLQTLLDSPDRNVVTA